MKKLVFLNALLAIGLFIGCSKEEAVAPPQGPSFQMDDSKASPVDISTYTFDNSVAAIAHSGCGDAAEFFNVEELDQLDQSDGDGETRADGYRTCCSISNLQYWGPPQWQPQVSYTLSGPNAWEATAWFRRITITDNASGVALTDVYLSDPTYPTYRCSEDLNFGWIFGPGSGVGPLCPNDYTFTVTRYYEWLFSGILVECCSKSIEISVPINPNLPPCG